MQPFLDQVAEYILKTTHSSGRERIALVTPNRRAGIFLRKYFSRRIKTASLAPEILSMESFISRITGIGIQEPVDLLLRFYQIYRQEEGDNAESLDEFLKWAPIIIKDFNDIDAHVDNPPKLFENVVDIKKIETWNPDGKPPSDFQKNYVEFFKHFSKWHKIFCEKLLSIHTAYQGLAYRVAARTIADQNFKNLPWEFIYFTGFNALNDAEEIIIRTLVKNGKADLIWDADKYYTENKNHEAGHFLRNYRQFINGGTLNITGDHFSTDKNINIYGVAKNVNQARLAANILNTFDKHDFEDIQTALVLASEDMLLPVLNSIPAHISKINITMGLPVRKTGIYALFESFFQMHLTTLRMKSDREGLNSAFYFKDIIRFFSHPAISVLLERHNLKETPEDFRNAIYRSKKTFLTPETMSKLWNPGGKFGDLFNEWLQGFSKDSQLIIPALKSLVRRLQDAYYAGSVKLGLDPGNAPWVIDAEALFTINAIINKLETCINNEKDTNDLRILFMLFQALTRESKLVLAGEPLEGLQIMGMLETRNLDFKNLIILSANEDILPAAKSHTSLIPFDVRAGFKMHSFSEKDAIYAYHFYRLLQRAENIHIIYNTQTQNIGSSEKSRFITQLQMEMPSWNPGIKIREQIIPLPAATDNPNCEISIQKTPEIEEKLEKINEKAFSPSTLRHYIQCPLLFYFRHAPGIKESILPEETIQANTLGTVIHKSLEDLYKGEDVNGKQLQPAMITNMLQKADNVIKENFATNYDGGDISSGKNLLLSRVALRFVRNFLLTEKSFLSDLEQQNRRLIYISSEEPLVAELDFEIKNGKKRIRFSGFADRVDQLDGVIRIIDYKTGKTEEKTLKIKEWPALINSIQNEKSFQLMMYAMLYRHKHKMNMGVKPGIFSLRKPSSGLMVLETPEDSKDGIIGQQSVNQFEMQLNLLLSEIFDSKIPFLQTPEEKNCTYCDFKMACNRTLVSLKNYR
jgi:ATP-dependent helicase/nuclease subunit B